MSHRTALMILALALAQPAARADQEPDAHMHHGSGGAVAQLSLDAGKKWGTDESLRTGMAAIRTAFNADHPAIHAGTQTDAQYDALAARIEGEVGTIVKNCHLPAAADAKATAAEALPPASPPDLRPVTAADPMASRTCGVSVGEGDSSMIF